VSHDILWPLAVYLGAVVALVGAMVALSAVLGQRHRERATGEPYESGIVPTGSARLRFGVGFYVVALLFVIFDLEAAFVIAWAVSARRTGIGGYLGLLLFLLILVVGLIYELRIGALAMTTRGAGRPREQPGGAK